MKREIIIIDEDKCNGCGLCVPNCHEGALQIIDGKARLISDVMCDGLGACIGFCPEGAITIEEREAEGTEQPSALTHWPVQMHLVNPRAGHFMGSNLLLAADCTAFSLGSFHRRFLNGKTLAIACPKLDTNREVYVEKLRILIEESQIDTLTVMIMEVPCCGGLLQITESALSQSSRQVPVKVLVVSVDGQIKLEKWHRI